MINPSGPWRYVRSGYGSSNADWDIVNKDGGRIASTPYEWHARRITACVNALERLSTEALERTVKAGGRSLIAEIEAEREAQAQRNANPQRPPTKRERFTDAIRAFLTRSTDRRE